MKKLLLLAVLFLGVQAAFAIDFDSVKDNTQAVYFTQTKTWSTGGMSDDRIVLTKKMSPGSGGYSEYYFSDGKVALPLTSNFEFIFDGRLIAVNNADLKYNEIVFEDDKFIEKSLSQEEVQKIFPDVEIIRISQFKTVKSKLKKDGLKKRHSFYTMIPI